MAKEIKKSSSQFTNRDNRSFDDYLKDINKYPLLSLEEEVRLAQRVRQGDKLAEERLINANLRFVITVAKNYQNEFVTLPDLISAGNMGLIKAARRFDETRGFKFISYALWWIRQSILQTITKEGRFVSLPANKQNFMAKYAKVVSRLEQELERTPSRAEIAKEMDIDESYLAKMLQGVDKPCSLDAPINDDEDSYRIDTVADSSEPSPDDELMRESLCTDVASLLSKLPAQQREVLEMSFGIGGNRAQSLEEIAMRKGLTRERVRQIKTKALARLRHITDGESFGDYLQRA